MGKAHAFVISCLLALCVAAGALAAMKTAKLGAATVKPAPAAAGAIASRRARLDRWSAALQRAHASKPPKLPAVPTFAPVAIPVAPAPQAAVRPAVRTSASEPETRSKPAATTKATTTAATPAVTYVQPPPIVEYQQAPPTTTSGPTGEHDDEGDDGAPEGDG